MEGKNNVKDYCTFIGLFIFSALFVFFNSKNSPLYLFNEWGDANIYFSMGKGMMNGLIPYKDIFDHKGPFIFFIYSLGYLISNDSFLGIYIIESVFLFVNLIFAFKIASIFLNKQYSFIVSLAYAVLIFNKTYYGGSAEEFLSVFITISFYYFILYFKDKDHVQGKEYKHLLIHGIMCSLAFLSKLSVCVFWMPLLIILLYDSIAEKKYREIINKSFFFIVGFFLPILPFFLYFVVNRALGDFYFGYIEFNSIYAEFSFSFDTIMKIIYHAWWLLKHDYISFPLTLLGVFLLSFTNVYIEKWKYKIAILVSFMLSFASFSISKYVMTYAHIVMYIYTLFGIIFLLQILHKYLIKSDKNYIAGYIVSFVLFLSIGVYNKNLFGQDKECLLRKKECNYMQKEFAAIINKENNPTLLDLGLDHGVFTKANIVPSFKYFFYPNIVYRLYPGIRDYQEKLIDEKQPDFIVAGNTSLYYYHYKELKSLKENYELINVYHQAIEAFDTEVYLYKRK